MLFTYRKDKWLYVSNKPECNNIPVAFSPSHIGILSTVTVHLITGKFKSQQWKTTQVKAILLTTNFQSIPKIPRILKLSASVQADRWVSFPSLCVLESHQK